MAEFSKDEIFTATEVVRNFSSGLSKIGKNESKRAVIVKNNKFEAILLSMSEYERLQDAVGILRGIYAAKKQGEFEEILANASGRDELRKAAKILQSIYDDKRAAQDKSGQDGE